MSLSVCSQKRVAKKVMLQKSRDTRWNTTSTNIAACITRLCLNEFPECNLITRQLKRDLFSFKAMTITVCRIGDGDSINLVTIIKSIYLPNDMQKCNIKITFRENIPSGYTFWSHGNRQRQETTINVVSKIRVQRF